MVTNRKTKRLCKGLSTSIIRSVNYWSIACNGSDSPMKCSSNFLYVAVSYFRAIALSPFPSVIPNTFLGDIDGL